MAQLEHRRSQVIARLPVDHVAASIVLADGERFEATLFVLPGDDLTQLFDEGEPFVPVGTAEGIRILARSAIACLSVASAERPTEPELPQERRAARLRLKCGEVLEGELRWIAPVERRRTADLLNEPARFVAVHGPEVTTYVAKAQLLWVEERR